MLYPVYVHIGDEDHAYGVTFPDFPGCFAASDSIDGLQKAVQEAVEAHFSGEDEPIPYPSELSKLVNDPEYTDGIWMLFDVDLSKIDTRSQRVNITLPVNLLNRIDSYTEAHKISRSAFLANAALKELENA